MFKSGDIFVVENGGKLSDGKSYTHFDIFEYLEGEEKGKGFRYSTAGNRYGYKWAYPSNQTHFIGIPDNIMNSFKHGSCSFFVEKSKLEKCRTILDLVTASDFKIVIQEQIQVAEIIENINSIEDVKNNWDTIKNNPGISSNVAE